MDLLTTPFDLDASAIPCCRPEPHPHTCWPHGPCHSPGKRPLVSWRTYTVRRPTRWELSVWSNRWPACNWAFVAGRVSGAVVLDVEKDALGLLARQPIPETVMSASHSGGVHLYFRYRPGLRNTIVAIDGRKLGDFKADGGYVVAPPSLGVLGAYEWFDDRAFGQHELADLPGWLLRATERRNRPAVMSHRSSPPVPFEQLAPRIQVLIRHGNDGTYPSRSEADLAVAGALVRAGWTGRDIQTVFDEYPIGEKYREKGPMGGLQYLQRTIERATLAAPPPTGPTVRSRVQAAYVDGVSFPGRPDGIRLHIVLSCLPNGAVGPTRLREGLSLPDPFRPTHERWGAFFTALGTTAPRDVVELRAVAPRLLGAELAVQLASRPEGVRVARFLHA